MARQVVWLIDASEDLTGIAQHIARDSRVYASAVVRQVLNAAASLADLPARGRIVPEVGRKDVRELILGNYRLIYRPSASEVLILAVIHGARELPAASSARRWGGA